MDAIHFLLLVHFKYLQNNMLSLFLCIPFILKEWNDELILLTPFWGNNKHMQLNDIGKNVAFLEPLSENLHVRVYKCVYKCVYMLRSASWSQNIHNLDVYQGW